MTPKEARIGVNIFTGLVVASVALAFANLTWRLAGYAGDEPVISPVSLGSSGDRNIAPLFALAPFGTASGTTIEGGDGGLTLRAIFAAFPASESVALIAGPDGQVVPVSIGDATPGGIVEAIEPEKVILRTSSGLRILGFNPAEGSGVTAGFAPVAPAAPIEGGDPAVTAPAISAPTGVDAIRALIPPVNRSGVEAAPPPSRAAPPPPAISAPPQSAAPASGYRVGSRLPAQLQAAGIRPGDVIRTVNGAPVSSNLNERELLSRAMGASSARIELVRNGKRVPLTVPMR